MAGAICALVACVLVYPPLFSTLSARASFLVPTPTPTTERAVLIYVTATAAPTATTGETATVAPAIPPATLGLLKSPSAPSVPTNTPTAAATRVTATAPPTPLPVTSTLAPTVAAVPPPVLISPTDGEKIIGAKRIIDLAFRSSVPLAANQWYRVQVDFVDRAGALFTWCGWTQQGSIQFPNYYDEALPTDRAFHWQVRTVQTTNPNPSTCAAAATFVSSPSTPWTFYWY